MMHDDKSEAASLTLRHPHGNGSGVPLSGEALGPEALKLVPFVAEVISTSPRDTVRLTVPDAPRVPDFIGKPVDGPTTKK